MKKVLCVLFVLVSSFLFSQEERVISQKELLSKLNFERAQEYEKYKEVLAREAEEGEIVKTYTSDGLETENVAKLGDYIVKNQTSSKEMYILTKEKFNKRYIEKERVDEKWSIYKPVGKIKGIKVTGNIMKLLEVNKELKEFYIMANWGEKMVVKKGDYLVSPYDNSEVYRIAEKEFFETYKRIEKEGKFKISGGIFLGF